MAVCSICKTPLDQPGRDWTSDCGGDCVACMADVGDPECVKSMKAMTWHEDGAIVSSGNVFADLGLPDPEFLLALSDVRIAYDIAMDVMRAAEPIPLTMLAKDMAALLDGPLDDGGGLEWAKLRTKVSMAVVRDLHDDMVEKGDHINARLQNLISDIESGRWSLDRVDRPG